MRAYNEIFLHDGQRLLADAFDYAINDMHIPADQFSWMFVNSKYCRLYETGNPAIISGMSGIEFARIILEDNKNNKFCRKRLLNGKSPEYWAGYYLAYYQWYTARNFKDIFKRIPFSEIISMYNVYHEMDVTNFIEALEEKYKSVILPTNLKTIRENRGLSQSELAKASEVSLRMIQLYEQKENDIDKAQAKTLDRLARVLGCNMEDLLENNEKSDKTNKGIEAMKKASKIAKQYGIQDMSLDEINEEITKTRETVNGKEKT